MYSVKCGNASQNLDIFLLRKNIIKSKRASGNYVLILKQQETGSDTSQRYAELAGKIMFDICETLF